jgi:anti-repressor protein
MQELIVKEYLGNEIVFKMISGEVYAKANSMTDSKKLENWKASPNTKKYIKALSNSLKNREFIKSEEGRNGGTWIHEKLVLSLARYVSVEFEIWCDTQITTLIREGKVELTPSIPQTYAEALLEAGRLALENEKLKLTVKEQKPKVQAYETLLTANNSQDVGEVAKSFGIGRNKLFKLLREEKLLMSNNTPYQKHLDSMLFEVIEVNKSYGEWSQNFTKTMITTKGIDKIRKLLQERELI